MTPKRTREAESSGITKKQRRPNKERLDVLMVERDLAPSRERAQATLLAGQVRVNGIPMSKPGTQVDTESKIEIVGETLRYSSRGGLKLEGALEDFSVSPADRICLDVGSSTGGFTDCLLQHGARKVYAVDVTVNQLDWKLQKDKRVVAIERNARYLQPSDVGEIVGLVTMDVSFISVSKILPAIVLVAAQCGDFLILVKPQFELEKGDVGKGGIVRDPEQHQKAVERARQSALDAGLEVLSVQPSRLSGAGGNQEFFLHARRRG
jgi:23S rRNA (cytidine1920-2'-O)/16S rRNA (cytidine1409-2'-O)-methyltransferase